MFDYKFWFLNQGITFYSKNKNSSFLDSWEHFHKT